MESKKNKSENLQDFNIEDQIASMLENVMDDESKFSDSENEESLEIEKEDQSFTDSEIDENLKVDFNFKNTHNNNNTKNVEFQLKKLNKNSNTINNSNMFNKVIKHNNVINYYNNLGNLKVNKTQNFEKTERIDFYQNPIQQNESAVYYNKSENFNFYHNQPRSGKKFHSGNYLEANKLQKEMELNRKDFMVPKMPIQPQLLLNNLPIAYNNDGIQFNNSLGIGQKFPSENNVNFNNNYNLDNNNFFQNQNSNYINPNLPLTDKSLNVKTDNYLYKPLTLSPKMLDNKNLRTINHYRNNDICNKNKNNNNNFNVNQNQIPNKNLNFLYINNNVNYNNNNNYKNANNHNMNCYAISDVNNSRNYQNPHAINSNRSNNPININNLNNPNIYWKSDKAVNKMSKNFSNINFNNNSGSTNATSSLYSVSNNSIDYAVFSRSEENIPNSKINY